jgi:hypothetical protein
VEANERAPIVRGDCSLMATAIQPKGLHHRASKRDRQAI